MILRKRMQSSDDQTRYINWESMNSQIAERIKEAENLVRETKSAYRQAVKHLKEMQRMQKQLEFERIIHKPLIMPNDLKGLKYSCGKRLSLVSEKIWHYALAVYEDSGGHSIPLEVLKLISPSFSQKKFRDAKIEVLRQCTLSMPGGWRTNLFSHIEYTGGELYFLFDYSILFLVIGSTGATLQ